MNPDNIFLIICGVNGIILWVCILWLINEVEQLKAKLKTK